MTDQQPQQTTFPSHLEPLPQSDFKPTIVWKQYTCESQLQALTDLIDSELSEPYSVFTYRHFVNNSPELTYFLYDGDECIGGSMSKIDKNKNGRLKGYIGMLVVSSKYRGQRLGSQLVRLTMKALFLQGVDICLLETECGNSVALNLYENLGFVRTKLLPRYYMNNADAFRLKFWLTPNVLISNHLRGEELRKQEEEKASPSATADGEGELTALQELGQLVDEAKQIKAATAAGKKQQQAGKKK